MVKALNLKPRAYRRLYQGAAVVLLVVVVGGAAARPLGEDEKQLIGQTMANFAKEEEVRIEWTPFVEDFARNKAERRIYCATLEVNGSRRPFMIKVVEEINHRILAIQPEHVYVIKPDGFTDTLNNSATLQYCRESGYAVSAP